MGLWFLLDYQELKLGSKLPDNAGVYFFTLMWASNAPISQLHFQLSKWQLVHKTLTFPKLPFPIARKISKWSKVTARKSKHSNIKWLSNCLKTLHYFYMFFLKIRAEKSKGYPSNFLLLLEIWLLFKTWCLTGFFFFFSFQLSCKGKFPGSAFVNGRSSKEPSWMFSLCPAC